MSKGPIRMGFGFVDFGVCAVMVAEFGASEGRPMGRVAYLVGGIWRGVTSSRRRNRLRFEGYESAMKH